HAWREPTARKPVGAGLAPPPWVSSFRVCALLLLVGQQSACAAVGFPPLRAEVGSGFALSGNGESVPNGRLAVGVAAASLRDLPVEVGVGYQAERALEPEGPPEAGQLATARPPAPSLWSGSYAEVAGRLHSGSFYRTWFGVRGSMLWPQGKFM